MAMPIVIRKYEPSFLGRKEDDRPDYTEKSKPAKPESKTSAGATVLFAVHLMFTMALLGTSFLPWITLESTGKSISLAEIMVRMLDGSQRSLLTLAAGDIAPLLLYTPLLLVPVLVFMALRAANDAVSTGEYVIALVGFIAVFVGISVAPVFTDYVGWHDPLLVNVLFSFAVTIASLGIALKVIATSFGASGEKVGVPKGKLVKGISIVSVIAVVASLFVSRTQALEVTI
jgi:hypothetical protein